MLRGTYESKIFENTYCKKFVRYKKKKQNYWRMTGVKGHGLFNYI